MAWLPLYLLPLVVSTGLCADPVLTQPPSASAAPGASAKLTCTLSQEHSSYNYVRWFQQRPGQAPRFLMYILSNGSHTKGDGIPDRFSGSSSGADRYLTISSLQSEDEAEYICGLGYNIDGKFAGFHSDTDDGEVGLKPPSLCLPSRGLGGYAACPPPGC